MVVKTYSEGTIFVIKNPKTELHIKLYAIFNKSITSCTLCICTCEISRFSSPDQHRMPHLGAVRNELNSKCAEHQTQNTSVMRRRRIAKFFVHVPRALPWNLDSISSLFMYLISLIKWIYHKNIINAAIILPANRSQHRCRIHLAMHLRLANNDSLSKMDAQSFDLSRLVSYY